MTAALVLTSASHTIACASCNAPWPLDAAQCPGCGRIAVASITAQVAAPSPDGLRAQLAAVTAERDALRAAVRLHRVATFEELNEAVTRAELFALVPGDCPRCGGGFCGGTASTCCRLNAEDMDAPAHNPGARVIATGGGR